MTKYLIAAVTHELQSFDEKSHALSVGTTGGFSSMVRTVVVVCMEFTYQVEINLT